MKSFKYIFALTFALVASLSSIAQDNKPVSVEFTVGGVCEMCEKRIEKAVDVPGVIYADYNLENHKLSLVYKPKKISEDQIHKLLNEAGHDTEKSKASDEQYAKIHSCCQYREHVHDHDHDH
ncbi:MAG: heavy-metal-associated domain-containing protein [Flavobacteriales bacterium]|nr:heavy-metal-associated domain-containing protein [Flavobacteriales bacterium]